MTPTAVLSLLTLAIIILAACLAALSILLWRALRALPPVSTPAPRREVPTVAAPRRNLVDPNPAAYYADLPGNTTITAAPMIDGVTLGEWIRHHHPHHDGAWPLVVAEFYRRAADFPAVASYFARVLARPTGMEELQQHFTRALMMVTAHGITAGTLRYLEAKHASVTDEQDRRITFEVYDAVIATLVGILAEQGVPRRGIEALDRTIAPIRGVIAVAA